MDKEENLTTEQMKCLNDQVIRFNDLMNQTIINNSNNISILPKNTLMHITNFDNNIIKSISETGIITGQAVGLKNCESTNYCANFYKVNKELDFLNLDNIFENENKSHNDLNENIDFNENIAFVIYPNKKLNELLKYDFYLENTKEGNITRSFSKKENNIKHSITKNNLSQSSILFGIPSNFITYIVITDNSIMLDKINFLKNIFKNIPILRENGEFIYNIGDSDKLLQERIIRIQNEIELFNIERNIQFIGTKLHQTEQELLKIKQAIETLPDKYKKEIEGFIEK